MIRCRQSRASSLIRAVFVAVTTALLTACAMLEPGSLTYSRADIAKQALIDRRSGGFGELLKNFEGADISGPDVGFATSAGRIELAWTARLASGPLGVPLSLSLAVSGVPELNESRDGIDLTAARVERVRIPFVPLGGATLQKDQSLARIPLLVFDARDLNRDGVLYQADSLSLGTFGLRVKLVRK